MKILIPLLLLSIFLIPLVQSSYAQENTLQSFFNKIIPKLQNFTQMLSNKVENLKNNASSEVNQRDMGMSQEMNNTNPYGDHTYNKLTPNYY